MAISKAFGHYAVAVAGASAATIDGVRSCTVPGGHELITDQGQNSIHAIGVYVNRLAPVFNFSTQNIHALISAITGNSGSFAYGMVISSSNALTVSAIKYAAAGGRASGSVHLTWTVNAGLLLIDSLSVNEQGNVEANCSVYVDYDGSNQPIVFAQNAALPTGVADDYRYGLGLAEIDNVALASLMSLQVNLGNNVQQLSGNGDIYPTFSYIGEAEFSVSCRLRHIDLIDPGTSLEWFGQSCVQAATRFFLRRRLANNEGAASASAGYYPDASSEHISISVLGMAYPNTIMDSSGGAQAAEAEVMLRGHTDASGTVPIIAAIDQAMSLT